MTIIVILSVVVGILLTLLLLSFSLVYSYRKALDKVVKDTAKNYDDALAFMELLNAERLSVFTSLMTRADQFKRTQPAVAAALRAEAARFEVSETGPSQAGGASVP